MCLAGAASADESDAVVCLQSHGGSGTVIATGEGWTLILSCAHCFEGNSARKPVKLLMPFPTPNGPKKVGTKVLAVGPKKSERVQGQLIEIYDPDLSLIKLNYGPVPYVAPVAPLDRMPREALSIGFDEMEFPAKVRPAKVLKIEGNETLTDARPWHGRSGGALIDKRTGNLVGVVSAYTMTEREGRAGRRPRSAEFAQGAYGVYVSLPAIHRFLAKAGVMKGEASEDLQDPFSETFKRRSPERGSPYPEYQGGPSPAPRR